MGFPKLWRRWPRLLILLALFTAILMWKTHYQRAVTATGLPVIPDSLHEAYPLLWKHIHTHKGVGGGKCHLSHLLSTLPANLRSVVHPFRLARWKRPTQHYRRGG